MRSWPGPGSAAATWSGCRSRRPTGTRPCSSARTSFEPGRGGAQHNLGFARGPHFCPGAQLASAETTAGVGALIDLLPGLRLDPDRPPPAPRGLVFRKPPALHVGWDGPG